MKIKSLSLGLSAGLITSIAFGICGVLFAIMPGPTSAFLSWVLHLDVTGMTRVVSVSNLLAGVVVFGAYVGLVVAFTAAMYNRLTRAQQA
jgi:hypothetical protein